VLVVEEKFKYGREYISHCGAKKKYIMYYGDLTVIHARAAEAY
jgi:hypothetical protein